MDQVLLEGLYVDRVRTNWRLGTKNQSCNQNGGSSPDHRVNSESESNPSPSQETESVFFFLIVEKGRFSTLPFRFEKFES